MSGSQEPWERTLELATKTLRRANRVTLDTEAIDDLSAILRAGCQRARAEGRDTDYAQAGEEFVAGVARTLEQRGYGGSQDAETPGHESQATRPALGANELRDAVASLCPGFWPFC
jgi:hypothetical protein